MKNLLLGAMLMAAFTASGELFNFYPINHTANEYAQSVGGQLSMEVVTAGAGSVSVLFQNTGPVESEVREIYFYTPNDLNPPVNITLNSIINGPGVNFDDGGQNGVNPSELPSGSMLLMDYTVDTAVDSKKGLNPGESLELILSYAAPPYNFIGMLHTGQILVGVHVAKIQEVSSVSYLHVIPEPASMVLFTSAAASFAFARRRFMQIV